MRLQLLIMSTLLIIVVVITCVANREQQSQNTAANNTKIKDIMAQEVSPEVCRLISGDWGTFETSQGVQKRMCGNLPCGYRGPLKLDCQDGKITGSKLLIYASEPPPGREVRAPIEASWRDGKIVMKYRNNQRCLIIYTVSIEGEELVGKYSIQDCGNKNEFGDFLAKKFPLRWTTDKSSQPPNP